MAAAAWKHLLLEFGQKREGMEKAFVVFRQGQLISLNLEDCISTKELGRKSDCFKSMGSNTYRS
jgi:hypothetical protein